MPKNKVGKSIISPIAFEIAKIPQMTAKEIQDKLVELLTVATIRYIDDEEKKKSIKDD